MNGSDYSAAAFVSQYYNLWESEAVRLLQSRHYRLCSIVSQW